MPVRAADPVASAVGRLLAAVERELGMEWSAEEESRQLRRAKRRASGWAIERADLAAAVLTALDQGTSTKRSAEEARLLLQWDRALGGPWADVDRALVEDALHQLEAALGPEEVEEEVATVRVDIERPLLAWPVDPVRLTSGFGVRADPFGAGERMHGGIDLAAPEGQPVWCAAGGEVSFAGWRGGYGLSVEIRHPQGFVTRYAHLSSVDVEAGERIEQGRLVGRAGATGRATGAHLHFEVWRYGLPVNPLDELPSLGRAHAGFVGDG